MKVSSKGKFEVKYFFLKLVPQYFEAFTSRGNVINPKIGQKYRNWYFANQC